MLIFGCRQFYNRPSYEEKWKTACKHGMIFFGIV